VLRTMNTLPNPQPQANFPGVAFSPAPRRPPRSAFKRALSRVIRRLRKYLDKKAAKYTAEQGSRQPTRPIRRHARAQTDGVWEYERNPRRNRRPVTRVTSSRARLSSGAPPLPRKGASTTTLEAKGPFSASQKRVLSRKLTTIQESSAEAWQIDAQSPSNRSGETPNYNEVDASSNPPDNGPNTPIPGLAELGEHFPNLTSKRCNVDWVRVDRCALNDLTLRQNTEAMRDISRDAAAMLRVEQGWIQRRDDFDDSAWREGSVRRAVAALVYAARWRRHRHTPSGQSIPSLSSSHSTQVSAVESFPTPANPLLFLHDETSIDQRLNSPPSKAKDSPMTPVITVSEWDEGTNIHDDELVSHPGASGMSPVSAPVVDTQLNPLRHSKPAARLRGKQPWLLKDFSSPLNPVSPTLSQSPTAPVESLDFFTEKPLLLSIDGSLPYAY